MSYIFVNPDNIVATELTPSGLGVALYNSFRAPIRGNIVQAKQNLKVLLMTRKGERWFNPDFGTNLMQLLFHPAVEQLKQEITEEIDAAVSKYMSYISLESIKIITAEENPELPYNVQVTLQYYFNSYEDTLNIAIPESNIIRTF